MQLTDTIGCFTGPCALCGTRSSPRSLESIAAITGEQYNRVDHVVAALLASMRWRIQRTAVYFCKYSKYCAEVFLCHFTIDIYIQILSKHYWFICKHLERVNIFLFTHRLHVYYKYNRNAV